ncbi:MAG: FlgD immunoglobulin-like domain containing protein [Bacteroidota bacterium]
MKRLFIIMIFIPVLLYAQTNEIPYNSKGNSLALTVENTAAIAAKNVTVEIQSPQSWLKLESPKIMLKDILAKQSKDAEFRFSLERSAPIGKEQKIKVLIKTSDGQSWAKEIAFTISPPKEFHLYDNFPNPFNPSTKIAFELPVASRVKLIIYDALGREVRTLTDDEYPAGYNELTWDGRNEIGTAVSSGVYFYRISTPKWNSVKKMVLLR